MTIAVIRVVRCDECGKQVEAIRSFGQPGFFYPPYGWTTVEQGERATHFCSRQCRELAGLTHSWLAPDATRARRDR